MAAVRVWRWVLSGICISRMVIIGHGVLRISMLILMIMWLWIVWKLIKIGVSVTIHWDG